MTYSHGGGVEHRGTQVCVDCIRGWVIPEHVTEAMVFAYEETWDGFAIPDRQAFIDAMNMDGNWEDMKEAMRAALVAGLEADRDKEKQ